MKKIAKDTNKNSHVINGFNGGRATVINNLSQRCQLRFVINHFDLVKER